MTDGSSLTTTEYAGNYIYENSTLQFFNTVEGYVSTETNNTYSYVYNFKDHLDNTRLSYTDANGNGQITQNEIVKESNYYPFGLTHRGYNNNVSALGNSLAKRYMFGGKEHQEEFDINWYDISARNYDAALGKWMNIDPLAEKMRRHSPYNYAFDNPIFFLDPDGMMPKNGILKFLKSVRKGFVKNFKQRAQTVKQIIKDPKGTYNNLSNQIAKDITNPVKVIDHVTDNIPGVSDVKNTVKFAASDNKGESLGSGLANSTVDLIGAFTGGATTKIVKNGLNKISKSNIKLGDLSKTEIKSIQKEVDNAMRPIEVVGSAARGERRNPNSDLPIGKGEGTRSDIDFLTQPSSIPFFNPKKLPGIDPKTGIIPGTGNPFIGPIIRFEPGTKPVLIPQNN